MSISIKANVNDIRAIKRHSILFACKSLTLLQLLILSLLQCDIAISYHHHRYHHRCHHHLNNNHYEYRHYKSLSSLSSLSSSTMTTITASDELISYCRPSESDLHFLSKVISDSFNGPFDSSIIGKLKRQYSEWDTNSKLINRFYTLINVNDNDFQKQPHGMIVARDNRSNEPVGFVEIGMVTSSSRLSKKLEEMNITCQCLPHIGNLVVTDKFRRKGIAKRLMEEVLDMASTWNIDAPCVLCAVEPSNNAAKSLYIKIGFEYVLLEERSILEGDELAKDRIVLKINRKI